MIEQAFNSTLLLYDATILKVEDRWYICSDAKYEYDYVVLKYVYQTPTLNFKTNTGSDGYMMCDFDGFIIEVVGYVNSLKLEYI